jgi:Uma2 family endonuclease
VIDFAQKAAMEMKEVDMASRIEPLLTVADLDAFPDDDGNRYELINGELFVSRAPGIPHQRVLHNLQMELGSFLKTNPMGILVPGAGAIFSDYDAVIPDLAFVSNERWNEVVTGEKFTGPLDLIIEILSPGNQNRQRDLLAKRQLYGKFGVKEYWIVDSENKEVPVLRLQGQTLEDISILKSDDELTSPLLSGFQMKVGTIFNL